jgi:hypothetical protein
MPQPGGCVKKYATTGRLREKYATTGRLREKMGHNRAVVSKKRPGVSKKVETGRLRQKKTKPGGCVNRAVASKSRNRAVASKKRPVASKKGRNRPVASKKRPVASKKAENARLRPKTPGRVHFPHHFPSFLSLSCSNHQYIHHQSLLCAQYCTLNAKECQKNETTPQTFMK